MEEHIQSDKIIGNISAGASTTTCTSTLDALSLLVNSKTVEVELSILQPWACTLTLTSKVLSLGFVEYLPYRTLL